MRIEGRTAVITGAASGIGRGTALALAKRGCNLGADARSVQHDERCRTHVVLGRDALDRTPQPVESLRLPARRHDHGDCPIGGARGAH